MEAQTLVVERVESGASAERAGLRRGDRLTAYVGQPLTSPALLLALEENTFGRESVTLHGERNGQPCEWALPSGKSGVEVRPELPETVLAEYERGRAAFQAEDYDEAFQVWSGIAPQVPEKAARAWLYQKVGEAAKAGGNSRSEMTPLETASELLAEGKDTAAQAVTWVALGRCCERLNEPDNTQRWFDQARQADEAAGRPLWALRNRNWLGNFARKHGDLSTAHDHLSRALAIAEALVPDTSDMAATLNELGVVAIQRNELVKAHDYLTRALTIRRRLEPISLGVAWYLNNLGFAAWKGGDLTAAQDYFTQTLGILGRLTPDSLDVAKCLNNLGSVAMKRGDLVAAQDYLERAHTVSEGLAPSSLDASPLLMNLGAIALERGDLGNARDYLIRALDIQKHLAPHAPETAGILNNLADVAFKSGDLVAARDYFTQALSLWRWLAPGTLEAATTLTNLGDVELKSGDLAAAQGYLVDALDIWERLAPGWPDHATTLESLGRIALYEHRTSEAADFFRQAVAALEQQRSQIATPEARALLLAQHIRKYAGLVQAYLGIGDIENAFLTLERARARSFVELLAARVLDTADAPPELLREQGEIDRQRGEIYDQLSRLTNTAQDTEAVEALHRTLRELERRQQELTTQIRAASPHYASLQYPQPISLGAAQAALKPGTLLLSYLVDDDQTFLFAVTATGAQAHHLPLGREALQEQVRAFRQALSRERLTHDAAQETEQSRTLYRQLVQPAQADLRRADRLLICPDGPLHTLPFAALVMNARGKPKHLGAQKPLAHILSATTQAQGRAARPLPAATPRLLAFGDPLYSASAGESGPTPGSDELSQLQTRGLSLAPLPHTRVEVESLARLFGDAATLRLGAEATKTAALRESGGADLLHFACHAWFDPELPLSSGLVLSQPETWEQDGRDDDNGLLQVWEIVQKLRLSADLVVLSACQSGLGQEVRGEGLVGLTRAFQYAGAESLVVSLWDINDASTSLFMQAFYTALQNGVEKDEALQRGILALKADPRWDAPCYWGAFVLIGGRALTPDKRPPTPFLTPLTLKAQQGDHKAFESLWKGHHPAVRAWCVRLLQSEDEGEQIAQEVFIQAWRTIARFRGDCPLGVWLQRVATNLCQNQLRTKKGMDTVHGLSLDGMRAGDSRHPSADFEEAVIKSVYGDQLRSLIRDGAKTAKRPWDALDADIFHLLYEEGITTAREVANRLGKSENTIKYRIYHRIDPILAIVGACLQAESDAV